LLSSWNERDKECIQNFSEEAFWKWPFGRQVGWGDNINMDLNILHRDNGIWMKLSESYPEACCCSGRIQSGLLTAGRLVRFSSPLQLHANYFVVSWNRPPVIFSAFYRFVFFLIFSWRRGPMWAVVSSNS